jgi:hnRNP-L/PTB/hephaestus splicing factor
MGAVGAVGSVAHPFPPQLSPFYDRSHGPHSSFSPFPVSGGAGGAGAGSDRCVLLLANLNTERTTCSALFNLFSVYGNIVRIKIFYNKPEHALVQMADPSFAAAAIQNLKGCVLFGNPIDVVLSKHKYINPNPGHDDDSGSSKGDGTGEHSKLYADYSSSRLNRFRSGPNGVTTMPRHIYPPSSTLHLSNLAKATTQETLTQLFSKHGTVVASKLFEVNDHPMCLIQFQSAPIATDALALMHGTLLDGHTIRIAFSRTAISSSSA